MRQKRVDCAGWTIEAFEAGEIVFPSTHRVELEWSKPPGIPANLAHGAQLTAVVSDSSTMDFLGDRLT
jgi:hypothetical protein